MQGKLIRLFLVDGDPDGLRTIEISNMTIHATIFPRTKVKRFLERSAANRPGVYILMGSNIDSPDEKIIYVGEGDPVSQRINQHSRKKDFWDQAIVFSSKDDYLTKTQIKYLESELYVRASEAHRAKLDNSQMPTKPNISEVEEAEVLHFLESAKLILSALGIDILEPRTAKMTQIVGESDLFELSCKGAIAKMSVVDNKYVVLKGSTAVLKNRRSCPSAISKLRQDLVESGILTDSGEGTYVFTQDAAFDSPSYAAAAVTGGSANGRKLWKRDGKSLRQLSEEIS